MNTQKVIFVTLILLLSFVDAQTHEVAHSFQNPVCRSVNFNGNTLTIFSDYCDISVTAFSDDIIKVLLHTDGKWERDTSFSVVATPLNPVVSFTEFPEYMEYKTRNIKLRINKNPILFYYFRGDTVVMQDFTGIFKNDTYRGMKLKLNKDEKIYGGGSRALPLNRRGYMLNMFNENTYLYEYGINVLNTCIPFFMSSRLYGLYLDNHSYTFVSAGCSEDSVFQCNSRELEFSYYFINGNSYSEILGNYNWLTGKQPLPPRWAFGYFQSKYNYIDQVNTMANLLEMRAQGFPVDAVVHDLLWFNKMGDFEWDKTRFPRSKDMLDSLKQIGIKTVLISECYVSVKSKNFQDAKSKGIFTFDNNGNIEPTFLMDSNMYLLDFTNNEALSWIWKFYDARIADGIDGWWFDLGEPDCHNWMINHKLGLGFTIHNIYCMLWYRKIYDGYREHYSNTRPFFLTRAGWAGMQRYGALPVCGDEARTWSGLKAQIPVMLGMSMSGSAYMHSDGGGYAGMYQPAQPVQYIRWLQFITFQPIMRVHMTGPVPAEPIFWPDSVKNIVRKYIELRYKLLPYNYTLAWENSTFAKPIAIPMNYYYPDIEALSNVNDQYFWGDNFLVAPIVDSATYKRSVILPEGNWINYRTGEKHKGNRTIEVDAPLETMPLFVRSGCFIPTAPPMMTTDNYNGDSLIIQYYPDLEYDTSSFTMYDDDGKTPEANNKNLYELIEFSGKAGNNSINISVVKKGYTYTGAPSSRNLVFEISRPEFKPGMIFINNEFIVTYVSFIDFINNDTSAFFDSTSGKLFIKFTWGGNDAVINITDLPTGIDDKNNLTKSKLNILSLEPNPVENVIKLRYNCITEGISEIEVIDISGKLTAKYTVQNNSGDNQYIIDTEGIPSGTYILKLCTNKSVDYVKFIKTAK